MLRHSFTTQWAERYVIYLQEQNSRIGLFHPLAQEKIISKGMLTKMARSGLEYRHLCIAIREADEMICLHYLQNSIPIILLESQIEKIF